MYSIVGQVEGKQLDRQQLVAISKNVHTHLVLAGAGTGKTTTIVGLVKYYIKSKSCYPCRVYCI
ncbi:MAG: UvrD-helicase domain-containing protein [Ruminococcus sp.]|nr:UvrD-helicase domain-containing protein [Ruminococcus sp.]